jgi:hypothetical protein
MQAIGRMVDPLASEQGADAAGERSPEQAPGGRNGPRRFRGDQLVAARS